MINDKIYLFFFLLITIKTVTKIMESKPICGYIYMYSIVKMKQASTDLMNPNKEK